MTEGESFLNIKAFLVIVELLKYLTETLKTFSLCFLFVVVTNIKLCYFRIILIFLLITPLIDII